MTTKLSFERYMAVPHDEMKRDDDKVVPIRGVRSLLRADSPIAASGKLDDDLDNRFGNPRLSRKLQRSAHLVEGDDDLGIETTLRRKCFDWHGCHPIRWRRPAVSKPNAAVLPTWL